jgi:uncharacterized protein YodC (DUF2158 family)
MATKFSTGDIVRLKSGGPWTTVTRDRLEAGSKFVAISWFNGSDLRSEVLPKDALEHDPARQMADAKKTEEKPE